MDPKVPLEITDPEDEFGESGGAGVEFDTEKLVGIDGGALEVEEIGVVAEVTEEVDDLALEALHLF